MTNGSIIQWNIQGIRRKKDELSELVRNYKANIVAIQETRLWNNTKFSLPHFNEIRKDGHYNRSPHGGVALYIHSSIPFNKLDVNTPLQAVAAKVHLHTDITICSLYTSGSHVVNQQLLNDLYDQLPQPVMILGDFNAHNTLWGSEKTDCRGRQIEAFVEQRNINIMNNGAPTRILYETETAIDVSLCSPQIDADFHWAVLTSPGDSDHCPIVITHDEDIRQEATEHWNMKKAKWEVYKTSAAWTQLPVDIDGNNGELIKDIYNRIARATTEAIPRVQCGKFYPRPWWGPELQQSKDRRERLYQQYRRSKIRGNLIAWRKARAQHKQLVKKHKMDSWIKFTETLHRRAPSTTIYETIRRIKGKPQRKINIIEENGRVFSTVSDIADKFAQTFYETSNDTNYVDAFRHHKDNRERQPINFNSSNDEPYNKEFTMHDLQYNLDKVKNTAPGTDGIYYQMINHMPTQMKEYLCRVLNKFYKQAYFPEEWRTAIIIPIPKPGKSHNKSANYRPIALTSCLCKIFERMINERLLEYLEMEGVFANIQCGCRKNKSTMDHLVRLENEVRKAFAREEHMVSVFFDLEKAYDMTWRHGILEDLYSAGMRGHLPQYIQEFLKDRKFKVRVGNYLSDSRQQVNGVPQGSVLSVTLFALKINSIAQVIPTDSRVITSLYVDDLQIGIRHCNLNVIQQEMQQCLRRIDEWTRYNGFKFSATKTKAMHFTTLPGLHFNKPQFYIGNQLIPYSESIKFLGLIWDPKLTWKEHIARKVAECNRLLGMMRSTTSQKWGADQHCAMKIYRMFIRSKLDYGAPVYASATRTLLKPLNAIVNEALRIATGAFKSTPIESLYVLANEMSLDYRREYLTLRYFYKTKSHISNPATPHLIPLAYRTLFRNKGIAMPLNLRTQEMIEKYQLRKCFVKPAFSYKLLNITKPSYTVTIPEVNFELAVYQKIDTPREFFIQSFNRLASERYGNHLKVYTDGSKRECGVGAAVVWNGGVKRATLPKEASIYSAEFHAIVMAIGIIAETAETFSVIFSDSHSVLRTIRDNRTQHPIARKIIHDLDKLRSEKSKVVKLCWIPSHTGIAGNEAADRAAVAAAGMQEELIGVSYRDFYPLIYKKIQTEWNREWQRLTQKLKEVKREVGPWKRTVDHTRREEVIINRLRSGHCHLTHGYLMNDNVHDIPPMCGGCQSAAVSVKHVLLQCPAYEVGRRRYLCSQSGRSGKLSDILGDSMCAGKLIAFLQLYHLYDEI